MTRPVVGSLAEEVYASLAVGGFADHDEENNWALLHYVNALTLPMQTIYDWAGEDDTDLSGVRDYLTGPHPGWSKIVDVDRAPDAVLPWLAGLAGVKLGRSMTADQQRAALRARHEQLRGRPATMADAVRATLTGAKRVLFRERWRGDTSEADAYHLSVVTYTSETPDPTATLASIVAQKPAGLVLHYSVKSGQDYQQVKNVNADYAAAKAAYATYEQMRDN